MTHDDTPMDRLITTAVEACRLARAAGAGARRSSEAALRAIRDAGQQLAAIQRSPGGRPRRNASRPLTAFQDALQRAHITRPTASEWMRVGTVSDDAFDGFLAATGTIGGAFTQTALFAYLDANAPRPSTGTRTYRVSLSDRQYATFRRQLETLAAARFADRAADLLVGLVDREFRDWLARQPPSPAVPR
jgi:hypothetical protein